MILKSKRGLILILSSPSGAGKTTLAKKIERSDRNFKISVSYTTRTPRANEVDGVDYNFVTIKKFQELASQDKFLEQAKVFGNYYATLKGPIEDNLAKGIDYLFDIDWQGTEQVKKIMPSDIVSVFILPPSIDDLESRLKKGSELLGVLGGNSYISYYKTVDNTKLHIAYLLQNSPIYTDAEILFCIVFDDYH